MKDRKLISFLQGISATMPTESGVNILNSAIKDAHSIYDANEQFRQFTKCVTSVIKSDNSDAEKIVIIEQWIKSFNITNFIFKGMGD